ncbi:hypothetical protein [Pseudomonas aeruginosa]|uniref:hypothetical protein n=2 Tax=Pseudomonas aeruginosa TaxID=287 RepID=UPI000A5FE45A|nr:hypothetical protein [Pseudomonas aeruginosa]MBR7807502.1 hypothetical protein [Pseudomonas aeruginosa]MBR7813582.1 hypothetical protein [Pseudomonas aeruginosa]MBR7845829.1 hypothetical protein [Pseudomonas aeruginosa]MBR7857767.1 hypothetical protein [Pseudomonas aeruginosa]MBR7876808.1 hypothetical protein [Pseudomonas aeruginosa]
MNKANECTCPSGDGSLVHPCPAHPAVDQAGGDRWDALQSIMEWTAAENIPDDRKLCLIRNAARAALAQPSQSQYEASFEEWLANELEGEDGHPVPAAVCDIALARRAFNHWPKLEQPAKVGGVRFSAGVSSRLVVEAAQRLYEFESTPEKEAERIEQLQAFREQLDPLNLAPHAEAFNEAPDEALRPEQAEAERSALWAVHAQGPDELYAAFSREDAEKHAAELNALPMPEGIAVGAVVVPSPWPAVQHWQYLAEQEQDHKNEIAGRLRQHERIGEALRAEIAEWQEAAGRSRSDVVAYIAERAKLLEERDTALTKVAELEKELEMARDAASKGDAARHAACGMEMDIQELKAKLADPTAVHQWQFSNAWFDGSEEAVLKAGKEGSPIRTLYAAPPAQAQHSVPIAPELKRALGLVVAALEADGDRPTSKYALSELKKVLAAAPGKEGV